jgi:hypothetical protein
LEPYQVELQVQPPVPPVPALRQVVSVVAWLVQPVVSALPLELQLNVAVARQASNALNWLLQLLAERFCRVWQPETQLD